MFQKIQNDHWHTKYEAEFKPKQIEDFNSNIDRTNSTHRIFYICTAFINYNATIIWPCYNV